MMDKRIPCHQDCPDRSATCKCTCEKWAEWEKIKQELYAKRKLTTDSWPGSAAKKANAKRKKLSAMRGRKQ